MTPVQKLKKHIIETAIGYAKSPEEFIEVEITAENVDSLFDGFQEDDHKLSNAMSDAICTIRGCGEETSLTHEYSRHYESYAVAAEMSDGTWVGWTYWYGGGKHSDPDSIPWVNDAYEVKCETVMKPVKVFTKV